MNATSFDDLVSVREASELLRVSESTVWRWINAGVVPSYRVGRKRVYLKRGDLSPKLHSKGQEPGGSPSTGEVKETADEIRARALRLLEEVRELRAKQAATPGWFSHPEAWEDINEMRDERSREQA